MFLLLFSNRPYEVEAAAEGEVYINNGQHEYGMPLSEMVQGHADTPNNAGVDNGIEGNSGGFFVFCLLVFLVNLFFVDMLIGIDVKR